MQLELHQLLLRYKGLRTADPRREGRLLASLAQHGQLSDVLVVKDPGGGYVLIDGYRRVEGLRRLGCDTVQAQLLEMSEREALAHAYRLGQGARRTALEEGWLLRVLCQEHRLSQAQVAVQLQRSPSWVSRRLALVKQLPERVQELVRRGKICAWAAQRFLVPLARANPLDCETMAEGIKQEGLSARQIGRLYEAWRSGGPQQRERIAGQPVMFLRALEEAARPEPPAPATDLLVKDIRRLGSLCRGLRMSLKKCLEIKEELKEPQRMLLAWQETLMDMRALELAAKEVFDAGCGNSHSDHSAAS